jgi:hypothetical protein
MNVDVKTVKIRLFGWNRIRYLGLGPNNEVYLFSIGDSRLEQEIITLDKYLEMYSYKNSPNQFKILTGLYHSIITINPNTLEIID